MSVEPAGTFAAHRGLSRAMGWPRLAFVLGALASGASAQSAPQPGPLDAWTVGEPLMDGESELRSCAASGDGGEWYLRMTSAGLRIAEAPFDEQADDALPFHVPAEIANSNAHLSSVLAVDDGFLVALSRGEWGGGLWWVSRDGGSHVQLLDENVRAVVNVAGEVIAVTGLAHGTQDRGHIRTLRHHGRSKRWRVLKSLRLDSAPRALTATADELLVVTADGVSRYRRSRLTRLIRIDFASIAATSIVRASDSLIYVGTRYFVVRLTLERGSVHAAWLRPPGCSTLRRADDPTTPLLECHCE